MPDRLYMDDIIKAALKEDMPYGDITTGSLDLSGSTSKAVLKAKQSAVIAGLDVFERVFELLDAEASFSRKVQDGDRVKDGDIFLEFEGKTDALLMGERTALNFLQHLSGIATKTAGLCALVKDLPVRITDTRKTMPGLRYLEKYAVRAGGGANHRFSLSDGVLLKDNHIKAAGSIGNAVRQVRGKIPHTVKIEVETETISQVKEALEAGADIIMLDNMSPETMAEAVRVVDKRALTEASGNMGPENIYETACTGVDIISVGGLTHTVKAADISMRFI